MKKIQETNFLFAIIFFSILLFWGIPAGKNLYYYQVYGEVQSNYDMGENNEDLQSEYAVNFPWKVSLIDLNGFLREVVGQREMNGVLKLNNGYLTAVSKPMDEMHLDQNAQAIIDYSNYCKENDILFLYVQSAYKISKWDDQLPVGAVDGHNETVDKLLSRLNNYGVNTMDLREEMHMDAKNQYELFFRTDHHWTTEGAFYGYQKIASWISETTDTYLDEELLDIDNYQIDKYANWHLGMRGQRTGSVFAGIDDFDLIYPKFDTHICNSTNGLTGSLKDMLINMGIFQQQNISNRYTYDSAYALTDINDLQSIDAKTDLNVLLLSDSFQQAINPYMLLTYKDFNVSEYTTLSTATIDKYQPDIVIMLVWPGYFTEKSVNFSYLDDATTSE